MAPRKTRKNSVSVEGRTGKVSRLQQTTLSDMGNIFASLAHFKPPLVVRRIAQQLLCGDDKAKILSEWDISEEDWNLAWGDLKNVAWIASQIETNLPVLIGLCDLAVFRLARSGDVTAYKALVDRAGKKAPTKSMHLNVTASAGEEKFKHLTDEQLEKLLEEERQKKRIDLDLKAKRQKRQRAAATRRKNKEREAGSADLLHPTRPSGGLSRGGKDSSPEDGLDGKPLG
jgi:hypothetical protein